MVGFIRLSRFTWLIKCQAGVFWHHTIPGLLRAKSLTSVKRRIKLFKRNRQAERICCCVQFYRTTASLYIDFFLLHNSCLPTSKYTSCWLFWWELNFRNSFTVRINCVNVSAYLGQLRSSIFRNQAFQPNQNASMNFARSKTVVFLFLFLF